MRREELSCSNCSNTPRGTKEHPDTTEHVIIGFIPENILEDSVGHKWIKGAVCSECGALQEYNITEDELDRAERRYLKVLVETGNLSARDARHMLGID